VSVLDAVWLTNVTGFACWVEPITNGVMSTERMVGGPAMIWLVVGLAERWIGRRRRHMHPKSRFEVDSSGCTISLPGGYVGYIANGLHVRHSIEKDVRLLLQPPVGNPPKGLRERQCLSSQVEFKNILAGWGWRNW
jgi:hypothetical protein